MSKGLTNQPLVIWVAAEWFSHPEILKLMAAGHRVVKMDQHWVGPSEPPGLILHPAAHFWTDAMFDYLPAALTAARARRRKKT